MQFVLDPRWGRGVGQTGAGRQAAAVGHYAVALALGQVQAIGGQTQQLEQSLRMLLGAGNATAHGHPQPTNPACLPDRTSWRKPGSVPAGGATSSPSSQTAKRQPWNTMASTIIDAISLAPQN